MSANNEVLILQYSQVLMRSRFIWPPNGEEDNPSKRYYLTIILIIAFSCSIVNGNLVHLVQHVIISK